MTTVATAMIDVLTEAGVRHIFGVPSGPWAPYMDAMRNRPRRVRAREYRGCRGLYGQ
jgi:thiamine pyrophosphate-dependent acetolactate synthase large subunit-like protein